MKIRLVDHDSEMHQAYWGTCELCSHSGLFDFVKLKFQADDGSEPYWVDAYYYLPYDGPEEIIIRNLFDFAYWLSTEKVFSEGFVITTDSLQDLVYEFDEWEESDDES